MSQQVKRWLTAGVVAPWEGRIGWLKADQWTPTKSETTRYVGVPDMTAIVFQTEAHKQQWMVADQRPQLQPRRGDVARNEPRRDK